MDYGGPVNIENAYKLWENRRKQQKSINTAFEPGNLVLVRNFSRRRKLDSFYTGPFRIVQMKYNTTIFILLK